MWIIVEYVALAGLILISITEFFYPLLFQKPLFGSFRKTKVTEKPLQAPVGLDEKISIAKEKVEEIKKIQDEVDAHHKSATDLKNKSDDLLK